MQLSIPMSYEKKKKKEKRENSRTVQNFFFFLASSSTSCHVHNLHISLNLQSMCSKCNHLVLAPNTGMLFLREPIVLEWFPLSNTPHPGLWIFNQILTKRQTDKGLVSRIRKAHFSNHNLFVVFLVQSYSLKNTKIHIWGQMDVPDGYPASFWVMVYL